jgi:uncharacterized protein YbgA (DUF1722 family)/uncharacterized protein YbbK (DUF523 family)
MKEACEMAVAERMKIGISSCLLGHKVRYDGGHKRDRYLTDTLGQYLEFVPVCPEVEYGLGIPREALRLVGDPQSPRLLTTKTHRDHTDGMLRWARNRVIELEREGLCGFIFKSNSPSSGMERVKVYTDKGMPEKKGSGIFAKVFMDHFPLIPVEEEGRLHDAKIRENFVERIFTLKRWRKLQENGRSLGKLVDFHTRNKLLILSHSPKHCRIMGHLVAEGKKDPIRELNSKYEALLMETLKLKATIKKNVNVLQHIMGYFKRQLSHDEKQELLEIIQSYHNEDIPLIVPVTILNHYVRKYDEPYLLKQTYLNPHPLALHLRNHV